MECGISELGFFGNPRRGVLSLLVGSDVFRDFGEATDSGAVCDFRGIIVAVYEHSLDADASGADNVQVILVTDIY